MHEHVLPQRCMPCPTNVCRKIVQRDYIIAHEGAMNSFRDALDDVWKFMCRPGASSMPSVICILMAKELTEWGHALSCVAETTFLKGWNLPTMAGGIILPSSLRPEAAVACNDSVWAGLTMRSVCRTAGGDGCQGHVALLAQCDQ